MSLTDEIQESTWILKNHLYLVFWLTKRPKLEIEVQKKFGLEKTNWLIQNIVPIEKSVSELEEKLGRKPCNNPSVLNLCEWNHGSQKDQNWKLGSEIFSGSKKAVDWPNTFFRLKKECLSLQKSLAENLATICLFWDQNLFKSVYKLMWTFELAGAYSDTKRSESAWDDAFTS